MTQPVEHNFRELSFCFSQTKEVIKQAAIKDVSRKKVVCKRVICAQNSRKMPVKEFVFLLSFRPAVCNFTKKLTPLLVFLISFDQKYQQIFSWEHRHVFILRNCIICIVYDCKVAPKIYLWTENSGWSAYKLRYQCLTKNNRGQ